MSRYADLTEEKLKALLMDMEFTTPKMDKESEESWKKFEEAYPLQDAPEGWEDVLRAKLMEELEDGCYQIGGPGAMCYTGKGGYISV